VTDYPDWQAYPNAQSGNVFPAFAQTITPGVHLGQVVPATNWASITVIVHATAGACRVTVNHFADAAGTQQIDSDTWPVNTLTGLTVRTPLRGQYVRIDLNVTSAGNLSATTWANFLSTASDRISFPVGQQNVSDFSHSLPASTAALYQTGQLCAGRALFFYNPHDTAGKTTVSIHAVDELGNPGQLVAFFGAPTALVQQLIEIPDLMVQVEIDNTDAVTAHVYDMSLTVPPQ
jgi:hypothetical protein